MKKSVYFLFILVAVLLLASCKKETDNRSGLELLVNQSSANYCVLVVAKGSHLDTVVWQTKSGDRNTGLFSGWGMRGVSYYVYTMSSYFYPADTVNFTMFKARFEMRVPGHSNPYGCAVADSILKLGETPFTSDHVSVNMGDQTYSDMSTLYISSPHGKLEIISVTKISTGSGCGLIRVKAKFSEVQFGQYQCFEPAYIIKQGLIQMDYQVQ